VHEPDTDLASAEGAPGLPLQRGVGEPDDPGACAAELERQRLGRDLHDSLSGALFALHTRAQVIARALSAGDQDLVAAAADELETLSREAIAQLRATVTALRGEPSAGLDLTAALRQLAAVCSARDGLPVRTSLADPAPAVDADVAEHLLRVAGEALHNCAKHAQATGAELSLEVRGCELVLAVTDDGRGFEPGAPHGDRHGQRTMRERAVLSGGWLHVDSAPGRGTRVVVRVPLPG